MREGFDTEHNLHMLYRYMCIFSGSTHIVEIRAVV